MNKKTISKIRNKGTLSIIFLSLIVFSVAAINFFIKKSRNQKLKNGGDIVVGTITGSQSRSKSQSIDVDFMFYVKGKKIIGSSNVDGIYKNDFDKYFLDKSFPLIYLKDDAEVNEILITPDRFGKFNIKFPDSLRWVIRFWRNDYYRFD